MIQKKQKKKAKGSDLMTQFISREKIFERIKKRKDFQYFAPASDRSFRNNISESKKQKFIRDAELAAAAEIPMLTAADYMKFAREGNRIAYETPYIKRRTMLFQLVMGEYAEYKGRFIDNIVEILWQTISEPVWCWPAHQHLNGKLLPEPEHWVVDLFAAQTAKLLSDTLQLLGPELEKDFAPLCSRIRYEISHRVLEVTEKLTDENCYWYGGDNNWSVWCSYAVSCAAFSVWHNETERLAKHIAKHMIPCERFFDKYYNDGACQEGPCYWAVSVGMLMNYLNVMQKIIGGMDDIFNSPKLKAMNDFLPRLNLYGNTFLNFADAEYSIMKFPRGLFYNYGKCSNSSELMSLALNMPPPDPAFKHLGNRDLIFFDEAFYDIMLDNEKKMLRTFNAVDFWDIINICIMRQNPENPSKGTVLTVKGGHNGESHGHFDLGHITLHRNGQPLIIDIGRGEYNQKVFSANRYDIWYLNSEGHNTARFNNCNQGLGKDFYCTAKVTEKSAIYDITHAYPAENKINSYIRMVDFDRQNGNVILKDSIKFEGKKEIDITFFSPVEPSDTTENSLRLGPILLECSNIKISRTEEIQLNDNKLNLLWGRLYRIDLHLTADNTAEYQIHFKAL